MTTKYSVAQARANLPKILSELELGGEVELTKRGKPVAVMLSVEHYARLSGGRPDFGTVLDEHRRHFPGVPRSALKKLRDESAGRDVSL